MILDFRGEAIEATPENSAIFIGPTLINGMYIDMDDDYLFLPDDPEIIPMYDVVRDTAVQEGIPVYQVESYDPGQAPWCFCINALCRVFQAEIDWITGEHDEGEDGEA